MWQRGKHAPDLLIALKIVAFSIYSCNIPEFFPPVEPLTGKDHKVDNRYPLTSSVHSFHHNSTDVPITVTKYRRYPKHIKTFNQGLTSELALR